MSSTAVIQRGLEILEDKGWNQGRFGDEKVGYCISGALYRAACEQQAWEGEGQSIFRKALRPIQDQIGIGNIAIWNDAPERTFSQVREVFNRAAYLSEEKVAV